MFDRLRGMRDREEGFTLIELLIVIVILGILAAIVVFAVGGITDRGQTSACKTDKQTLRTAEEANFAQNGAYVNETGPAPSLVANGFLAEESTLYNVTATDGGDADALPGDAYSITVQDAACTGI